MIIKKKYLIIILISIFFNSSVFSAGTNDGNSSKIDDFKKASNLIKQAKKYEAKGKNKKAKKRFQKALDYLLISNKKKPNQPDTLNYLGYTSRKIGNFELLKVIIFKVYLLTLNT